jgi:hypothetical protein
MAHQQLMLDQWVGVQIAVLVAMGISFRGDPSGPEEL